MLCLILRGATNPFGVMKQLKVASSCYLGLFVRCGVVFDHSGM